MKKFKHTNKELEEAKRKTEENKQEKHQEQNAKDIEIHHPKLGKVKIGDIKKNEACRMLRDLIAENMQLRNQFQVSSMLLSEIKVGDLEQAKKNVMEKIKNQEQLKKEVDNIKDKPTDI